MRGEKRKRDRTKHLTFSGITTIRDIHSVGEWVCDSLFQRLQSTVEVSKTRVSFLTIGQKDEGTRRDQQEDKDDDKDNDKGKGTDT